MVVDTSALMAVVFEEPDREVYVQAMAAGDLHVSTATLVEATVVALGRGEGFEPALRILLNDMRATIVPVDEAQAELARGALRTYGKGRHPARLNLGDSFAYALAMHLDEPLLFKGDDFAQTDVKPALST
jgi:ribonuclease VapC